jgi:hypothetical protein
MATWRRLILLIEVGYSDISIIQPGVVGISSDNYLLIY